MAADRLRPLLRELQLATAGLPGAIDEHIAGLNVALAAARAEVDALGARLVAAEARALQAETAADESARAAAAAERSLDATRADADRLRTVLGSPESARLRNEEPGQARGAMPDPPRPPHARSAAPAKTPAPTESAQTADARPAAEMQPSTTPQAEAGPAARIAEVFHAWCGEATPVMGKVEFFAGRARTALPDAVVTALYRDVQSQAVPVRLGRTSGNIPVEYWLVALDGRHWLLPQPMAPAQFRELAPCFEGTATPATLAMLAPAEVRVVGDRYEVPRPGRVA